MENPYWDGVKNHVRQQNRLWGEGPQVARWNMSGGKFEIDGYPDRDEFVHQYAWTITDPESVEFVAHYGDEGLVDPMAGTGYWAYVLGQVGVDVVCYDLEPGRNHTFEGQDVRHVPITKMTAVESVKLHPDRTLLLSWAPYNMTIGNRALAAYKGDLVIHMGEYGGCTGDEHLQNRLERQWVEVDERVPVQWEGLHDRITVYARKRRLIGKKLAAHSSPAASS